MNEDQSLVVTTLWFDLAQKIRQETYTEVNKNKMDIKDKFWVEPTLTTETYAPFSDKDTSNSVSNCIKITETDQKIAKAM